MNIKNLSKQKLLQYFDRINEEKFRVQQLYDAIYKKRIFDFGSIYNFSKELREQLSTDFILQSLCLKNIQVSKDGSMKFLYETTDNHFVETVFLPNKENTYNKILSATNPATRRNALCISTMIGCPVNCKFCATAKLGYVRKLDTAEIIDQILLTQNYIKKHSNNNDNKLGDISSYLREEILIKNIVFMGMGEPLMNFDNLLNTLSIIKSNNLFPDKSITISTIGVPDKIRQFADLNTKTKLAWSLHSPYDDIRTTLIPITHKYSISEVLESLDYYYQKTRTPITIEYILFRGLNNRKEDAIKLMKIARRFPCKINLIPYNSIDFIDNMTGLKACNDREVGQFAQFLYSCGLMVIRRKSQGADINAGCGQLAYREVRR